jgi:hypothetical protein
MSKRATDFIYKTLIDCTCVQADLWDKFHYRNNLLQETKTEKTEEQKFLETNIAVRKLINAFRLNVAFIYAKVLW